MPPFYDIYGLSDKRSKKTVEKFLCHFSNREKVENKDGQEIMVYQNEKYNIEETWKTISTLTEVINFGIENQYLGFVFYIGDNLKHGIGQIILKFTFDQKIIFGISIEEKSISENGKLHDNYDKAVEIEKIIVTLTNATKSSIQFEHPPADDEEEFDENGDYWKNIINKISNK